MSGLDLKIGVTRPRCPYCHGDVLVDEAKAACDACMAWHHVECFEETGSCGACGEQGAALRRASEPEGSPPREDDPRAALERLADLEPELDAARRVRERFGEPDERGRWLPVAFAFAISVLVAAAIAIGGAGLFLLLPAACLGTLAALQIRDPLRRRRAHAIRRAIKQRRRERRREQQDPKSPE